MATFSDLIKGDMPVLVDVYADWCGPCKMLAPTILAIKKEFDGKARVIKVDIDKNQAFAQKLGIQGVPTLLLYKEGKLVWRQSGVLPQHEIAKQLNQILA